MHSFQNILKFSEFLHRSHSRYVIVNSCVPQLNADIKLAPLFEDQFDYLAALVVHKNLENKRKAKYANTNISETKQENMNLRASKIGL